MQTGYICRHFKKAKLFTNASCSEIIDPENYLALEFVAKNFE